MAPEIASEYKRTKSIARRPAMRERASNDKAAPGRAPVFVLGRRVSGLVAIQPGHRLVTTGLYGVIRHPGYLGLFLLALGWGLAFRSGVGVAIAVLMLVVALARIKSEERLLSEAFGPEYDSYRARTLRLVPNVY